MQSQWVSLKTPQVFTSKRVHLKLFLHSVKKQGWLENILDEITIKIDLLKFWDASKAKFRGKFIVLGVCTRKEESS